MASSTAPQQTAPAQKPGRLPPDEKFWKRYSPHQEAPLSAIASFALHFLAISALIVLAWLGWLGFRKTSGAVPVEAVRFLGSGGGGGRHGGVGDGPGIGNGAEPVATTETQNDPNPIPPDLPRPKLDTNAVAMAPVDLQRDDSFKRYVRSGNPNLNIFRQVNADALSKMRDGLQPGKGEGGPGQGGGKGTGTGTGEGDGKGPGKSGALTQREKRMLRWTMLFNTRSGQDYLAQLRSLGAILAVPAEGGKYKIIRDLSGRVAPALLDEDVSKIQCIFWVDERPESVRAMMGALHLQIAPPHFVAFMPQQLEKKLYEMEKAASGGVNEDLIQETKFVVKPDGRGGYVPEVDSVRTQ